MIQIAFDGTAAAALCGGFAAIITATATLVWAVRRDPRGGNSERLPPTNYTPLPPAE